MKPDGKVNFMKPLRTLSSLTKVLSAREKMAWRGLAQGLSVSQIAEQLPPLHRKSSQVQARKLGGARKLESHADMELPEAQSLARPKGKSSRPSARR
jgi:hypothetical protein